MQQQVRIITTKKGYEEIMSFLRSHNNKKLTKNIAQRVCIIDRNYIKLYDNTLLEDEYKDIPMPSMTCEFNDKETIKLLKQIDNGGNENGI